MLEVSEVKQKDAHTCGVAALQCVLRFWKLSSRGLSVQTTERDGTHPTMLQAALQEAGLYVFAGEIDDLLAPIVRSGKPVIALTTMHGGGHYVVVHGVSRGRVYFMDPVDGFRSMKWDDWRIIWRDRDGFANLYSRFGICGHPKEV